MGGWIERVDEIPWQVIALSGLIGFLVLVRYVQMRSAGRVA